MLPTANRLETTFEEPQPESELTPLSESFPALPTWDNGCCATAGLDSDAHLREREVRRELLEVEGIEIRSLVVRPIPNGVCLQGYIECGDRANDVARIARRVNGVIDVIDQLIVGDPSRAGLNRPR